MDGSVIETERLCLREYTWEDADVLATVISDPETMKYYDKPYDEAGVRRWIQWNLDNYIDLGFGLWAIELKGNGRYIGDCGITMQIIDRKIVPEVGYHIHREFWNMGYATEAARACRDWAFENTTFGALYSYMNAENTGSFTVAEKNGMTLVKIYEDRGEKLRAYSITREEWSRLNNLQL